MNHVSRMVLALGGRLDVRLTVFCGHEGLLLRIPLPLEQICATDELFDEHDSRNVPAHAKLLRKVLPRT